MAAGTLCEICGNEIDGAAVLCSFCGSERFTLSLKAESGYRVVNLEKGMPFVHEAVQRMRQELDAARLQGCRVMIFIHGYGSSGKGGAIRREVRRLLSIMLEQHEVHDMLIGEKISKRSGHTRQLLHSFSFLEPYLKRSNPGVTVVVL